MVLVMGDCHESIGYRSPAAMGRCHECCGGACGGRLSVRDQEPAVGLLMVAQRPLREPQWQTSVQSLPLRTGQGRHSDAAAFDKQSRRLKE